MVFVQPSHVQLSQPQQERRHISIVSKLHTTTLSAHTLCKCMEFYNFLCTLKKPTKLDGNDTTTISHHPYILCHFAKNALCLLLVVCIGGLWKAVGWVVLGVECMLMCRGVSYVVGGCNIVAILSTADMVCLECRNC